MEFRLIPIWIIAAFLLCLFACILIPKKVVLTDLTERKEIELAVGGSLLVTLASNPTTGFKWELVKITDKTVLKEAAHKFEAPSVRSDQHGVPMVGAPGKELWTFKALKKGESTVYMEYSQPWEGGIKAAKIFILTIIVK